MSFDILRSDIVRELCESIDSPRSLAVYMLYRYGEHEQLVNLSFDPLHYCFSKEGDIEIFRNDYLATEFLSKATFLETGIDLRKAAVTAFHEFEQSCKETNLRFRKARVAGFPPRVAEVLYLAQRKISRLHDDAGWSLDRLYELCEYGPGATTLLSRAEAYTDNKVLDLNITSRALKYLNLDLGTTKVWNDVLKTSRVAEISYVDHNDVTTVPKNSKTDRTIAIEPCCNMLYQKAYGNWLREALLSRRVTLRDQSRNQKLARVAVQKGLATVDLKGASASIGIELVWELLPYDVASVLDDLRSHKYMLDDVTGTYEQFSSMGNGFTFELESLIFWALTQSVIDIVRPRDRSIAIYGDDIIVSVECLDLLYEVFAFCGFKVNTKKTHATSGFRESCGRHYFWGFDVTPFYWKEDIDVLEEAYRLANRIRRLAINRVAGTGSDGILYRAWTACLKAVRHHEKALGGVYFEVPINSELDGGLALPLSEMKGYAYLRFKHGDRFVRKKEVHRYNRNLRSTRYYVWTERRRRKHRGNSSYVAVLRNELYRPELPFEQSRLEGTYGPSTVRVYEAAVDDVAWLR